MGDDIRDRFKSVRSDYTAPIRPSRPAAPVSKPKNIFGQNFSVAPKQVQPVKPVVKPQKTKTKRKKSKMKLFIFIIVLLLFISGGGAGAYYFLVFKKKSMNNKSAETASTQAEPKQPTGTITLLATGDFSAYDSVNNNAKTDSGYDYLPMMGPLKPVFDKFDIKFCNQATLGGGTNFGVNGYPTFNAGTEWSKGLEDLGCNLINVGSNHTNDKGQDVITAALNYYDNNKNILAINGANRSEEEKNKIRYFTLKDVKFAYLSYTTTSNIAPANSFGVNIYSAESALAKVEEAKKEAQFVIVSMNWGKEDSGDIQPEQETIAQELTTAGADLIIGNGPHVVQPAKILEGKEGRQSLVWFSLGNAVNSQLPNDNLFGGIGMVDIDIATQNMKNPRLLPTYMHYEWTQAQKSNSDFNSRKNLTWFPLDLASDALAKSLTGTTIEAQNERIKGIITKFLPVVIVKSTEL